MATKKKSISPGTFLATYREYESIIRNNYGLDAREFEDHFTTPLGTSRIRTCRQFRNYFVHENNPGFLEVTPEMYEFLAGVVEELKMKNDILKKHLKTVQTGTVLYSDKVSDVMTKLIRLKTNSIVVRCKDGSYGVIGIHDVAKALLGSKATKVGTLKLTRDYHFAGPLDEIDSLPSGIIICTDSGEADGKLLGVKY